MPISKLISESQYKAIMRFRETLPTIREAFYIKVLSQQYNTIYGKMAKTIRTYK